MQKLFLIIICTLFNSVLLHTMNLNQNGAVDINTDPLFLKILDKIGQEADEGKISKLRPLVKNAHDARDNLVLAGLEDHDNIYKQSVKAEIELYKAIVKIARKRYKKVLSKR